MASDERVTEISTDSENQMGGHTVVVLPGQSSLRTLKGGVSGVNLGKAERFRGVTRSLTNDAINILNEMWEDCQKSAELQDKYFQLYHCLDCLKRFCDGKL